MTRPLDPATAGTDNLTSIARHRPYPDYKDTAVEWLNQVPSHWSVERLKYVATLNDETLSESTDPDFTMVYVDIGSVNPIEGITETETLSFESSPSRARRVVRHGDVIVSTVRTYLRAIAPIEDPPRNTIVSTGFAVVRPRVVHSKFAFYLLGSPCFVERVVANSVGVGYPAINSADLACFSISLPSMDEQRAIAGFLDRETARIDALMAKKEELIELLKEKRSGLVTHAVTKGIDSNVTMQNSGIDWIGDIPAHWDLAALRRRWIVIDCKHVTVPFVSGGIPLASVRETQSFELDLSDARCTTDEWYALLIEGGRRPRPGDLIYCRNVSVGAATLVTTEGRFAMGQDVCLMRSSRDNPRWLNYFLSSSAMSHQLASVAVGSTFDRINISGIMSLLVPVVPHCEQEAISRHLDFETAKIDALVGTVHEAIARLRELRTALISAAVTGKIDVRETAA